MSYRLAHFLDRSAYGDSYIHRLDSRAKIIMLLCFIISVVSFPKYTVAELLPFFLILVVIISLSDISYKFILKRTLIIIPFVILIGIFNPFLDTAVYIKLKYFSVSYGWLSFLSITIRGTLCISMVLVIISTTKFYRLIEGARHLGIPKVLAVQLMLLYRYLFILIEEAISMRQAKLLRSVSAKTSLSLATSQISVLLIRTLERSEAIWMAMKSRGFDSELKTATTMKWNFNDSLFLICCIIFIIVLRFSPLVYLLGNFWSKSLI